MKILNYYNFFNLGIFFKPNAKGKKNGFSWSYIIIIVMDCCMPVDKMMVF